jgi:hypothetical protein
MLSLIILFSAATLTIIQAVPSSETPARVIQRRAVNLPAKTSFFDLFTNSPAAKSGLSADILSYAANKNAKCAHSYCDQGPALNASCHPCVADVIKADPYCGTTAWDSFCVLAMSNSRCGQKSCPGPLNNFEGPVISQVEVNMILWGGNKVAFANNLSVFYDAVVQSDWYDTMKQYKTTKQKIMNGSFKSSISLTMGLPAAGSLFSDADIQKYLRVMVKNKTITPNANSYYPIHLSPEYSTNGSIGGYCKDFCAYHSTIDISDISTTKLLYYGVHPDIASCPKGCQDHRLPNPVLDSTTLIASHELAETVTDAAVGVASDWRGQIGWYNFDGGEIGDMCSWLPVTDRVSAGKRQFVTQQIWSNEHNRCI